MSRVLTLLVAVLIGLSATQVAHAQETESASGRPVIGPPRGDALHVMSFNLRYASTTEPNSWAARRPVMAQLLRREQPTVLGTQEES